MNTVLVSLRNYLYRQLLDGYNPKLYNKAKQIYKHDIISRYADFFVLYIDDDNKIKYNRFQ